MTKTKRQTIWTWALWIALALALYYMALAVLQRPARSDDTDHEIQILNDAIEKYEDQEIRNNIIVIRLNGTIKGKNAKIAKMESAYTGKVKELREKEKLYNLKFGSLDECERTFALIKADFSLCLSAHEECQEISGEKDEVIELSNDVSTVLEKNYLLCADSRSAWGEKYDLKEAAYKKERKKRKRERWLSAGIIILALALR